MSKISRRRKEED